MKQEADMNIKQQFTRLEALAIGKQLEIELEHGICDPRTTVTGDDPVITGKLPGQT